MSDEIRQACVVEEAAFGTCSDALRADDAVLDDTGTDAAATSKTGDDCCYASHLHIQELFLRVLRMCPQGRIAESCHVVDLSTRVVAALRAA